MLVFKRYKALPVWVTPVLLSLTLSLGCFRGGESVRGIRPAPVSKIDQAVVVGTLLTMKQMDGLIAGEGCFGMDSAGCCSYVMKIYGYLWAIRMDSLALGIAALIDGRPSGRCF